MKNKVGLSYRSGQEEEKRVQKTEKRTHTLLLHDVTLFG